MLNLIFVFLLQQFDGNILGPKILGDSTGLSPFWVVFAIVLGGGLFGIFGMILGVPLAATLYKLSFNVLEKKEAEQGIASPDDSKPKKPEKPKKPVRSKQKPAKSQKK